MSKQSKPAIAYTRVSTHGQTNGHGLELQLTRIREFARHSGYEIVETFSDAHTGMGEATFRDRPGAREAVICSKKRDWPIIVDGLDRFARDTEKLEEIVARRQITIISARGGKATSRAVIMGEAARGQREGELISESTKRALQKLKEQGVRLGNPTNLPEAQAKGAASNRDMAEGRARELFPIIQELRQAGRATAAEIAEGLNQKGLQTARGGPWKATNVRRLLRRADELAAAHEATAQSERYADNPLWGTFASGDSAIT